MAYYSPASTIHGDAPINFLSDNLRQIIRLPPKRNKI